VKAILTLPHGMDDNIPDFRHSRGRRKLLGRGSRAIEVWRCGSKNSITSRKLNPYFLPHSKASHGASAHRKTEAHHQKNFFKCDAVPQPSFGLMHLSRFFARNFL
jgi:hypothetical protein